MLKAERHERPPCLPKLVLMQDETRRDWSKLNSYELFFFHPYTQLFMKEMCQWGHHPETCQRHSPAPQGAWTLHLAPMCAYFTVCILDHPEEESASSQCLSMAGSQASLGHSSRQLSGTKIFFFFFFSVWLQIPYTLSDCQPSYIRDVSESKFPKPAFSGHPHFSSEALTLLPKHREL